jgi:hypothetical protein
MLLFLDEEKVTWSENFGSFNSNDFLPTQKIAKKLKKM